MQHDHAETYDDSEQSNLDPVNETAEDTDDREKITDEAVLELVCKMSTPLAQIAKLIDSQNHARDMANNLADSARAAADLTQVQQNIVRVAQDLAASQDVIRQSAQAAQKQANAVKLVQDLVDSPAFRTVRETAARFSRWQASQAEAIERAQAALKTAANAVVPWLKNAARAIGRTAEDFYRRSLPPNWLIDDTIPPFSLVDAMQLALNEGIPLAWATDPETVSALMSVPADHPSRREAVCAVLTERSEIILAYSGSRLDALARTPSTSKELLSAIDVAQQAIRALRLDLPAPAQSAAANLVDHLISQLFAPLAKNGVMGYRKKREHVENLPQQVKAVSLTFLVVLREMVTLLAVAKAFTEWWPSAGQALPDGFSRHTTAHAIAETDQVNPTNALVAVMLAVSLICQTADSEWTALRVFVWEDDDAQDLMLKFAARRQSNV